MKVKIAVKEIEDRRVENQLAVIIRNADNPKKLFRRIKRLTGKNLVAYYHAARTFGDAQLAAATRNMIFQNYVACV